MKIGFISAVIVIASISSPAMAQSAQEQCPANYLGNTTNLMIQGREPLGTSKPTRGRPAEGWYYSLALLKTVKKVLEGSNNGENIACFNMLKPNQRRHSGLLGITASAASYVYPEFWNNEKNQSVSKLTTARALAEIYHDYQLLSSGSTNKRYASKLAIIWLDAYGKLLPLMSVGVYATPAFVFFAQHAEWYLKYQDQLSLASAPLLSLGFLQFYQAYKLTKAGRFGVAASSQAFWKGLAISAQAGAMFREHGPLLGLSYGIGYFVDAYFKEKEL